MLNYPNLCNHLKPIRHGFSWDKDLLGKEYLGEASMSMEEWFKDGAVAFEDPQNEVYSCISTIHFVHLSRHCYSIARVAQHSFNPNQSKSVWFRSNQAGFPQASKLNPRAIYRRYL